MIAALTVAVSLCAFGKDGQASAAGPEDSTLNIAIIDTLLP